MLKPKSLRAEIAKFLPELARDGDRLSMWTESGRVRATETAEAGFLWEYELQILVAEYTAEPALLFFIVTNWLRSYQPELIAAGKSEIPFQVDFVDDSTFDIKITLALSECVAARPSEAGDGWELETVAETVPLFPDAEPLRDPSAGLESIWIRNGEDVRQVAPAEVA